MRFNRADLTLQRTRGSRARQNAPVYSEAPRLLALCCISKSHNAPQMVTRALAMPSNERRFKLIDTARTAVYHATLHPACSASNKFPPPRVLLFTNHDLRLTTYGFRNYGNSQRTGS